MFNLEVKKKYRTSGARHKIEQISRTAVFLSFTVASNVLQKSCTILVEYNQKLLFICCPSSFFKTEAEKLLADSKPSEESLPNSGCTVELMLAESEESLGS